jgi:hypothetical protein
MGAPAPFQTKKGDIWSPWKAVVNGKTVELVGKECTREEAVAALSKIVPPTPSSSKKTTIIGNLFKSTAKTPDSPASTSFDSTLSTSAKTDEKPKPGELRKEGLSELSTAKVAKFRGVIASAIASGNVSLDRALVSIFRDEVPILAPEQHMLLSAGWELACEQYFVDGLPPPWIVILLGNAMVASALVEKSKPKKEEEPPKHDATIGATQDRK